MAKQLAFAWAGIARRRYGALLCLGLAVLATLPAGSAVASSLAKLQKISISYSHDEGIQQATLNIYKRSWLDACNKLGVALTAFQGYYQHGAFAKHRCLPFDPTKPDPKTHRWHLSVREKEDQVVMELSYQVAKNKEKMILATFAFGSGEKTMIALADEMIASQIAYLLLDQLPMARVVSAKEWRKKRFSGKPLIKVMPVSAEDQPSGFTTWMSSESDAGNEEDKGKKGRKKKGKKGKKGKKARKPKTVQDPITPYKSYLLYHLDFDEEAKSWQPTLLGYAKRSITAKTMGFDPDNPPPVEWKITEIRPPEGKKAIYAVNRKGRSAANASITAQVFLSLGQYGIKVKNSNLLADTLASGYVGIRYGFPLLKVQSIIAQSSVISAFADLRGGPLRGLRFMYDFAPEVKQTFIEGDASFEWDRMSLGWSFTFDVGSDPAKRIDIIPRVGLANYKANLPVVNTQSGIRTFVPFSVEQSLSYGGELGAEVETPWLLLRGWGAFDSAEQSDTGTKITSIRGGVDAYWDLFEISEAFDLNVVTFVNGERLSMSAGSSGDNSEAIATGLRFSLAFAGVGLTITW